MTTQVESLKDRHCMTCGHDFDEFEFESDSDEQDWNDPTICPKCDSDDTFIADEGVLDSMDAAASYDRDGDDA